MQLDLPTLLAFPGKSKKINLTSEVTNYMNFGVHLLDDKLGNTTKSLEREHGMNCERINQAIFTMWLEGRGLRPLAWSTLIDVFRQMQLLTLANEVQDVAGTCQPQLYTYIPFMLLFNAAIFQEEGVVYSRREGTRMWR